ncbi:MAG: PIG-L family deacetylase, partial [Lachnospiraceae bacterium]|nr:PIG-L family deacetylase [Lachnospiraceae bacterium]MBO4630725.1 PIG-L family deacetylase [Lentisphaeria bacterium]
MKKVLILGAHLDDSVISMGGTIARLVKEGAEVNVFCFGNGDEAYTVPGQQKQAVAQFKHGAEEAHKILGVKSLECMDVGDFEVNATPLAYRQTIGAIRKYKPDVIFGHWSAEYFQHHGMARMSIDAWNQARWNCTADYGTEPWAAKRYFHFEIADLLPQPSHLMDISDVFELKMKAMACFDAESGHLGGWEDEMRARARFYGSRIGV